MQIVRISKPVPQWISDLSRDSPLAIAIRWGSAVLAVAAASFWYGLFSKKGRVGRFDFAVGADALLGAAALGTGAAIPGLSYIFIWPLLPGLAAAAFEFISGNDARRAPGWPQLAGRLAAAAAAIFLLVPGILIAILSVDIQSIYCVSIFILVLLGFLIPPLDVFFVVKPAAD